MIEHPHDDIEAFALGALDEVGMRRVLAHADECPTCAVLVADAIGTVAALEPGDERPIAAPLSMGFASSSSARKGSRFMPGTWAVGVAAAAAIVGLLVWNLTLRSSMPIVPIAALVHSHFTHHALRSDVGNVKVIQALDGRWLYLVADGLTPTSRYELFETTDGAKRRVGDFLTTPSGQATAYWEQAPTRIQALQVVSAGSSAPGARWP